jgi:hypothetical protein
MAEFKYERLKALGTLSTEGKSPKEVSIVKWGDSVPKIDIRPWFEKEGQILPGKGVTLTKDEASILVDILKTYLAEPHDDTNS